MTQSRDPAGGSLGPLHRLEPFSSTHGWDRGTPIDRYYIDGFLKRHANDIRGHCLEVGDSRYTERFGSNVTRSDVVDIEPTNSGATILADLTTCKPIVSNTFDCFILVQTLHLIYDVRSAVEQAHRILKPGAVLLATVPAVGRIPNEGDGTAYWRFTPASCERLFGGLFGPQNVEVAGRGNAFACCAHLMGMAYEELSETDSIRPWSGAHQ